MTATNVSTGKPNVGGCVYSAPLGTTLPTSADSTPGTGFVELGLVSEDGLSNTNTPETDEIKDWGGSTVLVLDQGKSDEFTFTLIEALNPNVLKAIYGAANVSSSSGTISVTSKNEALADQAWVFDIAMRGGAMKRIVIPQAAISEIGEIVYKKDEAVGYEITLKAIAVSGVTHYEYIKLAGASS